MASLRSDVIQKNTAGHGAHRGLLGDFSPRPSRRSCGLSRKKSPRRERTRATARITRGVGGRGRAHEVVGRRSPRVPVARSSSTSRSISASDWDLRTRPGPGRHSRIALWLHRQVEQDFLAATREGLRRGGAPSARPGGPLPPREPSSPRCARPERARCRDRRSRSPRAADRAAGSRVRSGAAAGPMRGRRRGRGPRLRRRGARGRPGGRGRRGLRRTGFQIERGPETRDRRAKKTVADEVRRPRRLKTRRS